MQQDNTRAGQSENARSEHGISQNVIDETKENYGTKSAVDRDVGKYIPKRPNTSTAGSSGSSAFSLPEIGSGKSLSESVDEALKDASGLAAQEKAEKINESVKVGEEGDMHDLAARKQP
ncbi:hypothetical protein PV08_06374 [Exophiala spinifera]|uniref:Uncharacterized protein n=1 Tax=Exophiala spinifera TaxID=91928 RepID=A0A0D2BBD6_9EURO|nr:uncharacterized protein PV08_06374 [Exophiala spinifera]KIW16323.1 hypothetical protein PV08_06374 [Exophiala spinifera]